MCLENVTGEKITASTPIVVYKVAYHRSATDMKYNKHQYRAPFREWVDYNVGTVMTSRLTYERGNVYAGFHSFPNYADARALADSFNNNNRLSYGSNKKRYCVLKGYIPAGSEYYLGEFREAASYASDKLLLVREMTMFDRIAELYKKFRKSPSKTVG